MEQAHEKNLKVILRKSSEDFKKWVGSLSDEELTYVEWLLEKSEDVVDEVLLKQSNLIEANEVISYIMSKDK